MEDDVGGQQVWELLEGYIHTTAFKCAFELGIAEIIHAHSSPMSLSQIASKIKKPDSTLPDPSNNTLSCLMQFLVRKNLFSATSTGETTLYGLTPSSRLMLPDSDPTLYPLISMAMSPWLMDVWTHLTPSIKEGGNHPFQRAHGCSIWELASTNPDFKQLLHNGLTSASKSYLRPFLSVYEDGFRGVDTLVDVGGGGGYFLAEIVKANWPRIKGINFDLPSAFQNAPTYPGVTHLGGDMFDSIPSADAIIMKKVLHNWSDEDCMKILMNCKRALTTRKGKLILMEAVLHPEGREAWDNFTSLASLRMAVSFPNARERTQPEWIKLLEQVGFCRPKFIDTHLGISVIEAYPL